MDNPTQGNQYEGSGGGSVLVGDGASANYNGLVSSINHRLSGNFSLFANWTWSKCLNIYDAQGDYAGTGPENPYNPGLDYGPCGSDYRHIENVSLVAKSNFKQPSQPRRNTLWMAGNWRRSSASKPARPSTSLRAQDNSLTDVGNDRPNRVPRRESLCRSKAPECFGRSQPRVLESECLSTGLANRWVRFGHGSRLSRPRNLRKRQQKRLLRAQVLQFDAQISRIFPIHESWTTTLRLEAYNVLNHPNFSNPTAGLTSSTFGQISSQSNAARVFQGAVKVNF